MLPSFVPELNRASEVWSAYVVDAAWQAAAVALVAITACHLMRRRWPAPLRAALLTVALVKFLVPPTVPMPAGWFEREDAIAAATPIPWSPAAHVSGRAEASPVRMSIPGAQPVVTPARKTLSVPAMLMLLHGAGATVIAASIAVAIVRLRRLARRASAVSDGPLYEQMLAAAHRLGIASPPRQLLISDEPVPPMAFGIWRRRVMLPAAVVDAAGPAELDVILAHELAHHRRRDTLVTAVQLLVLAAWWFNPVAWLLARVLRQTREECCDDVVLAERVASPAAYCRAILAVAERVATPARTLTPAEPMHPLGGRMRRIMDPRLRPAARLSRPLIAMVMLLAVVALPGLRSGAAEPSSASATTATAPAAATRPTTGPADFATPAPAAGMDLALTNIRFEDDRLEDALRTIAGKVTLKLDVRWDALAEAKITRDSPIRMRPSPRRTRDLLIGVMWYARNTSGHRDATLVPAVEIRDDGTVLITTSRDLYANFMSRRSYEIGDMIPPLLSPRDREQMCLDTAVLVRETVEPDSWKTDDAEGPATVATEGTRLVVTQTDAGHRQVRHLLHELRDQRTKNPDAPLERPAPPLPPGLAVVLGDMRSKGERLDKLVDRLRDATKQNIFVNWKALEQARITRSLPVTTDLTGLTLAAALEKLLAEIGGKHLHLGYTVDDGVVTISTGEDLARNTVTRVYDIREAIKADATRAQDIDAVIARIQGIDPLSWRSLGGSVGAIRELQGQLIITQSPEVHERIHKELADMLPNTPQYPLKSRRLNEVLSFDRQAGN